MRILVLNAILFTAEKDVIPRVKSIKDTMIYNMCLGFNKLGHEVTLVAAEDYRPEEREQYAFDVLFFKSKWKKVCKPSVLPYFPELRQYLRKNRDKFDLIISKEVFSLLTLEAAIVCPKKLLIWHELNVHQKKYHKIPSKVWYNFVVPMLMKKIRVVACSESARSFIMQYCSNVSDICIEHGINLDKFRYSAVKRRQIISSAQLIPRKRVDYLIRKFADLHSEEAFSDVRLLIAGRGALEGDLKRLTVELGVADFVDFLGFVTHKELNSYIMESLCLLLASKSDMNAVSIPEAVVSGTPVLINSVPSSAYYIKANELGIVQDDWGVPELVKIINDNERYVANCIRFREKLSNAHMAQMLIDVFNSSSC